MLEAMKIQIWSIDRLIPYARNPRKNDHAVDRMCASLKEFGFKIPCLVRSDGEIVDGHLRLKAARKLGIPEIPVLLCDEWTPAQVKAFRMLVNRSVGWAEWDEDLLAVEIEELRGFEFNLELTGFEVPEIENLLARSAPEPEESSPSPPEIATTQPGDLWLLGEHRVLCGDATSSEAVDRLLAGRKPSLMVTDPPYGIELDSKWRDRAGLNGCGSAEPSHLKRTEGHRNTSISCDTRADWSEAFALVPSLAAAYVWHASKFTREVLDGLLKIGFEHHPQIIWNKGRPVLTRTLYWFAHEPCWFVRKKNAPWYGKPGENSTVWNSPSPKFIMGGSDEEKCDHPTQKPLELMRRPILNHTRRGELVYDPFLGSGTTLIAAAMAGRVCCGLELDPKYLDVIIARWQQFAVKAAKLDGSDATFEQVRAQRSESAGERKLKIVARKRNVRRPREDDGGKNKAA